MLIITGKKKRAFEFAVNIPLVEDIRHVNRCHESKSDFKNLPKWNSS